MEHRAEHIPNDAVSLAAILGDIAEYRRNRVGKAVRIFAGLAHMHPESLPGRREHFWRRVVGRGQPAVAQVGCAAESGLRAPAPNPDRWAGMLRRSWLQRLPFRGVELACERRAVPQ